MSAAHRSGADRTRRSNRKGGPRGRPPRRRGGRRVAPYRVTLPWSPITQSAATRAPPHPR